MLLRGRKILLAVTGSIAAYKAAMLVRLLVKEGAEVKVLMTPLAKEFITPLTLATLSRNPILIDFFNPENGDWNSHVELGLWADAYIIAPATANTIGKMAHGIADNLVLTSYLSVRCKVFVAPAMDLDMFSHPATVKNISILRSFGNIIIEPVAGELASGLEGKGRMDEPENIVKTLAEYFGGKGNDVKDLLHKKVMVTAGPTHEAIDPVRYIGNNSSGKMGFSIAEELANRGAIVILVSGPVSLKPSHPNIQLIKVASAEEMHDACISRFPHMDAAILSAAVADFTPTHPLPKKVKREKENYVLELKPTIDIAEHLGQLKKPSQVLVGFALETNDEVENAQKKLKSKNLDFIVLNSLNDPGAGFQVDTNKITILDKGNNIRKFELKSKAEVATDIVNKLITCF